MQSVGLALGRRTPSPLQSISGWELKSLINQEVPDFRRPTRKNMDTSSDAPRVAPLAGWTRPQPLGSSPATGRWDPSDLASLLFSFPRLLL